MAFGGAEILKMFDWFGFLVTSIWGNYWLAVIGWGMIFGLIGIVGRMSFLLLFTLLMLYFISFLVGAGGLALYIPLAIIAVIYFVLNAVRWWSRE